MRELNETSPTAMDRMKVKGPTFLAWIGYLIGGLALLSLIAQITGFNNFRPLQLGDVPFLAFGLVFGFVVMPWLARHNGAIEVTPEHLAYADWSPWRRIPWLQIREVEWLGGNAIRAYGLKVQVVGRDAPLFIAVKAYGNEPQEAWDLIRRYAPEAVSKIQGFPSGPTR